METVKEIDWMPKWDGGASLRHVFCDGQKVILAYVVADWENVKDAKIHTLEGASTGLDLIALVEFDGHTFRFGIANDEVFQGLPLYRAGLCKWAHLIENSTWIDELKDIHKIHPSFNPLRWAALNHYALLFKDEIMEVVATGYSIEIFRASYRNVVLEVVKRLRCNS